MDQSMAVDIWTQLGREIEDFLRDIRMLPVSSPSPLDVVRQAVASRVDFVEPLVARAGGQRDRTGHAAILRPRARLRSRHILLSIAEQGQAGLAEQIDRQARMGDALRRKLTAAGWIVVNETPLPLVCITHDDIRTDPCPGADIVRSIHTRGRVWVSEIVLANRERVVRACITSFRTGNEDLDILVDELERARTDFVFSDPDQE